MINSEVVFFSRFHKLLNYVKLLKEKNERE